LYRDVILAWNFIDSSCSFLVPEILVIFVQISVLGNKAFIFSSHLKNSHCISTIAAINKMVKMENLDGPLLTLWSYALTLQNIVPTYIHTYTLPLVCVPNWGLSSNRGHYQPGSVPIGGCVFKNVLVGRCLQTHTYMTRRDSLVVSVFDQRPRGRWLRAVAYSNRGPVALCTLGSGPGLTQPCILFRSQ